MEQFDPENVMRRSRRENAAYVIDQVRQLGLTAHLKSRLMQMHDALNRDYVSYGDPEFAAALEAERDMQILGFVFDTMQEHRACAEFRNRVYCTLKDRVLPQDNLEESPGRDAQFELYVAAIAEKAGLRPVVCEEPDVTCVVQGVKFGVAAKRLKSLSQFGKRVRQGINQVSRTKLPGIIAVDISLARDQNNAPIISPFESQMYRLIAPFAANQLFDKHHVDVFRWVRGTGVIAVVLFDFTVRVRPNDEWGLDGMVTWLCTTFDDEANRKYESFWDGFSRGIPNVRPLGSQV